ncbi:MAG TPA: PQQ-binding-like beta-propeller repeat protein [Gemmatales bacterium]|nr:PQQ-binding-like beta-propeller repeat protein [Gemmatales bacterium]
MPIVCLFMTLPIFADDLASLTSRPGVDWPCFLGLTGDGKTSEQGLALWKSGSPRLRWMLPVGEGYSAPIIVKGRCILFDRVGNQARCRCLNSETARELWTFTYPSTYQDKYNYDGGPRASPVCDGERVYLHGPEGMLHCLTLAEGKELWKVHTFSAYGVVQNFFGVGSTPLLYSNKLIVHIGGSPPGSENKPFDRVTSNGTCIIAFDKLTGKEVYQGGNDLASYSSPQLAMLGGNKVGLIFARDGLVGFDPDKGTELFRHSFRARMLESVNVSNTIVDQDRIFLTESYAVGSTLLQFANNKVEPIWTAMPRRRDQGIAAHMNTPILLGKHVYGCAGRQPNEADLRCIDLETGKVAWREQPKLGDYQAGRGTLTYADGHFLYLAEEGVLFLIKANPRQCEIVATWDGRQSPKGGPPFPMLPEPSWAAPVLSHGLIYLRGQGKLVCLEVY